MAEKRMFTKKVIDTDVFLTMPQSAQNLYFHLCMRADDDGFVDNPKTIQRITNTNDDDFKILVAKCFLITFESGVIVITHWKLHNTIQTDRYKPTIYCIEKGQLITGQNGVYTKCIQDVSKMDTQIRLDKIRLDKISKVKKKFEKPTIEEIESYCKEKGYKINAEAFFHYYESCDWMVGNKKMTSWKSAVSYWNSNNNKKNNYQSKSTVNNNGYFFPEDNE